MNRFEQKNMSFGRKLVYLLPILAFLVLFVLFLQGIGSVSESTLTKQQESLETALGRSISQCYAVEGCYPPSLEYLEQCNTCKNHHFSLSQLQIDKAFLSFFAFFLTKS